MNRKDFLSLAGLSLAGTVLPASLRAEEKADSSAPAPARTGNGAWIYESVPGWGALPDGEKSAPTHGGFVFDKAGNLYADTDGPSGVLVYGPDGRFLRGIAHDRTGIHAMTIVEENGVEYLYAAWLLGNKVVKLKLDGTLVAEAAPPAEAGLVKKWKPTGIVPIPGAGIFVSDGYGDSRIHIFDTNLEWKRAFGGAGKTDGLFRCSHALALDARGSDPRLVVLDRENRRISHFDADGRFVEHKAHGLRRPCQISFQGDHAVVSELEGRVTILDRDYVPVAFLGDNADKKAWANYDWPVAKRREAVFNAAHGVIFGPSGDIYVSEWSKAGRICKLRPVKGT